MSDIVSNLQIYWSMDDGSGSNISDTSGNGRNGTFVGTAAWAAGYRNGAASLNGTNAYIKCSDSIFDFTSGAFTFVFWIKPTLVGIPVLLSKGVNSASGNGYLLQLTTTGQLFFATNQAGFAFDQSKTADGGGAVAGSVWNHIAITRSGTTVTIYVNAVDVTSVHGTHADLNSASLDFHLGNWNAASTPTNLTTGLFDEFRLYTRALTQQEILILYSGSLARRRVILT